MTELSPALQQAIVAALKSNPDVSPETFIHDLASELVNDEARAAIREAFLSVSLQLADMDGGEHSIDAARLAMTEAINRAGRDRQP